MLAPFAPLKDYKARLTRSRTLLSVGVWDDHADEGAIWRLAPTATMYWGPRQAAFLRNASGIHAERMLRSAAARCSLPVTVVDWFVGAGILIVVDADSILDDLRGLRLYPNPGVQIALEADGQGWGQSGTVTVPHSGIERHVGAPIPELLAAPDGEDIPTTAAALVETYGLTQEQFSDGLLARLQSLVPTGVGYLGPAAP